MKRSALLDKLSTGCLQAINDMSGLSLAIERYSDYEREAFCCQMKMITILDFSGSIMGFCAVSFEEQMAANILGLGTLPSESERNELMKAQKTIKTLAKELKQVRRENAVLKKAERIFPGKK